MKTFLILYAVLFLLTLLAALKIARYQKHQAVPVSMLSSIGKIPKCNRNWALAIIVSSLFIYVSTSLLLSTAWLKGDDYILLPCSTYSLAERFSFCFARYINWVSRIGEIIASLIGISENRWQQFLITPAFITALPFTLYRLTKKKDGTIWSKQGFFFVWFSVTLALMSVNLSPWRNYWCYFASVTYLWPMTIIPLFLSFYRDSLWKSYKSSYTSILAMFLLGLYCAWSLECISLFLLPGLILWHWKHWKRAQYIPARCWAGLVGSFWGAFFLYSSPALSRRAAGELATAMDTSSMDFSQMLEFCLHLTPERLQLLSGGTVQLFLGQFPLPLRFLFLPELISSYLPCCSLALAIIAVLSLIMISTKGSHKKRILLITASGILLSTLCACSYLYSCIPTSTAFLPPAFIMVATACYLFQRTPHPHLVCPMLAIATTLYAASILIPAGMESWRYQDARDARMAELHVQLAAGKKGIVLHQHWQAPPQDKLGFITSMDLESKGGSISQFYRGPILSG